MWNRWFVRALVAGGFVAGCWVDQERTVTTGRVCITAESGDSTFLADRPVVVEYVADDCLSGCTRDISADIDVEAFGVLGFDVTGRASWTEERSPNQACTADCRIARATALTPALAAGDYVFRFGTQTVTLTVPSTLAEAPCITDP